MAGSPQAKRPVSRWSVAVIACLAVFACCWWAWEAFGLPPAGSDRLAVALAVAAAVSAAIGGPLFYWAGRERRGEPGDDREPVLLAGQVNVSKAGPVVAGDLRGAHLNFAPPATDGANEAGQVVVGEIPRQPPAFVERAALARLAEAMEAGQVAVVCAVIGLRGVGKTQLAAAYARAKIADGCGLVGWVNAESRATMIADLARVAERVRVEDPKGDPRESARRLREHLNARAGEGLLVFDNVADPDDLRQFLPAGGSTKVVITSIDRAFGELGRPIDVAAFNRGESLAYLAERTGLPDEEGADAVAAELGGLPLGLAQAAATIAGDKAMTYQAYLERLRHVPVADLLGRVRGGDYPHAVAAALLLNVQSAEARDASMLTSRILRVVAVLSPAGVRRSVLAGLTTAEPGGSQAVEAAVRRCVDVSLLTWSLTGDAVIMHRLLGRVLREREQAAGDMVGTVGVALDLLEPMFYGKEQIFPRQHEGWYLAKQIDALWQVVEADDPGEPHLLERLQRAQAWAAWMRETTDEVWRIIDAVRRIN